MKEKQKAVLIPYVFVFLLYSFLFILCFHIPIFERIDILFYRGVVSLVVTNAIVFLFIFILRTIKIFFHLTNWEHIGFALLVSICVHLSVFIVFPVTYERSLTMYMLNFILEHKSVKKKEITSALINEYILKNDAVGKRLQEQSFSSFLKVENQNMITLTKRGEFFLIISNVIKKVYGLR